jgi:hypothetical protein
VSTCVCVRRNPERMGLTIVKLVDKLPSWISPNVMQFVQYGDGTLPDKEWLEARKSFQSGCYGWVHSRIRIPTPNES